MNDFTYIDIFATKGIEYILVIAFLFLFYFFWKSLNKDSNMELGPTMADGGEPIEKEKEKE
jgi:hypothetical protein